MKTLILAFFILVSTPPAYGEEAPFPALTIEDAKPLRQSANARVTQPVDHSRLQLDNGRIMKLVGIEIPDQRGHEPGDQVVAAKEFLDALFEKETGRDVLLYQTPDSSKGRVNRMGHDLAHIVRKDGNVWVQGALLANGLAQAWPNPANPELADKMFALEDQAIAAEKGLWGKDSPYRLIQADQPVELLDRFAVAEGVVQKVAIVNNVTYLNFGDDYKKDFTIGIPAGVRKALGQAGIDVFRLQGRKLRVRGWIRFYNGPYIELEHPVLLQPVSGNNIHDDSSRQP